MLGKRRYIGCLLRLYTRPGGTCIIHPFLKVETSIYQHKASLIPAAGHPVYWKHSIPLRSASNFEHCTWLSSSSSKHSCGTIWGVAAGATFMGAFYICISDCHLLHASRRLSILYSPHISCLMTGALCFSYSTDHLGERDAHRLLKSIREAVNNWFQASPARAYSGHLGHNISKLRWDPSYRYADKTSKCIITTRHNSKLRQRKTSFNLCVTSRVDAIVVSRGIE